jgi:hypothetical protein
LKQKKKKIYLKLRLIFFLFFRFQTELMKTHPEKLIISEQSTSTPTSPQTDNGFLSRLIRIFLCGGRGKEDD